MTGRAHRAALMLALWVPIILGAPASAEPSFSPEERARLARIARELTLRKGEKRPEEQLMLWVLGRPLLVGGELELRSRWRGDFRLDPTREDDELNLQPKLELELFYALARRVSLFLEGRLAYDADVYAEDGDRETVWEPERGETWIHLRDIGETGLSFQAGRQRFQDEREWWWDSDLDALRLFYERGDFEFELAAARELAPLRPNQDHIDPELDDVSFLLGRGSWFWGRRQQLDLFLARRLDRSPTPAPGATLPEDREDRLDADLSWVGARATGRWKLRPLGRIHYWLDLAGVWGEETELDFDELDDRPGQSQVVSRVRRRVRGFGLDLGATLAPARPRWPRLTLGYAFGSGDRGSGRRDRAFRQTGLQDNNAKFRGEDRFKYYGEVFRPELSNLHIATISLGIPLLRSSSLELVYHAYWQDVAAPFLRDTRLKARPEGLHRSLGEEWNLVIGLEEWTHWEVELIAGMFRAGEGFGSKSGERAHLALIQVDYNF